MKNNTLLLFIAICGISITTSCSLFSSDNEQAEKETSADTPEVETDVEKEPEQIIEEKPVKIEDLDIDEEAKEVLQERVANSPFRDLGCCDSEETRFNECCCDEVLKKYKELADAGELGDLSLTDPILIDCKKGPLSGEFEKVDYGDMEDEYYDDI